MLKLLHRYKSMDENSRIVVSNIVSTFVIKGVALSVSYLMLPTYLNFFHEKSVLGLWFTILSVLLFTFHFNLGIGNGLRNHLSAALAKHDNDSAKKYISSAYFFITVLALVIGTFVFTVVSSLDLNKVFNVEVKVVSLNALKTSMQIVIIGLVINFVLGIINYILYAMQSAFVLNLISLCTSLLMLFSVMLCRSGTNDQNLVNMSVIHIVALNLPLLIASFLVFGFKLRYALPSLKAVTWNYGKSLLKLGGQFFYIQIAYLVIMGTNEYLISIFANSYDVVEYQIYYKLFILAGTIFAISLTPVWSVVTKALAENKIQWLQSLYRKFGRLVVVACAFEFAMIIFLQWIVNIWLRDNAIRINYCYALVYACFGSVLVYNQYLSNFANGIGLLKTQNILFSIGAILKVPLSYLLIKLTGSWIGVMATTDILILLYCIVQPITLRQFFKMQRFQGIITETNAPCN